MYIKTKPKYPVRKWLGKYSAYTAVMLTIKYWEVQETMIEKFLRTYPKHRSLEKFTATDFADYCLLHPNENVRPVQRFWRWLIDSAHLPLYQVAIVPYDRPKRKKSNLGIGDMLKLLGECRTAELKRKVIGSVCGGSSHISVASGLRPELADAVLRAGLPPDFRLLDLKARVKGRMSNDVIKSYCEQLLNALPPKPKFLRNPLRAIQAPAPDIGTPISDSDHDLSPVV